MPESPGPVHVTIYRMHPALEAQGQNLPSVEPNKYILLDEDAQECRTIGDDELLRFVRRQEHCNLYAGWNRELAAGSKSR